MKPIIGLKGGGKFDFTTSGKDDLTLPIIAASLSKLCRFNGHTSEFYSVAQHSVGVARLVARRGKPEYALWALLHDAPESVYGDQTSPLKVYLNDRTCGEYKRAYQDVDRQVMHLFPELQDLKVCHYTQDCVDFVHWADFAISYAERDLYMKGTKYLWPDADDPSQHPGFTLYDIDKRHEPWTPKRAEYMFMQEYEKIMRGIPYYASFIQQDAATAR